MHRGKDGQEGNMAAVWAGFRMTQPLRKGVKSAQGRHCTGRERGSSVLGQETGCELRDSRLYQIQSTGAARRNKMEGINREGPTVTETITGSGAHRGLVYDPPGAWVSRIPPSPAAGPGSSCTPPFACCACLCRGCLLGPGLPSAERLLESPPSWVARCHHHSVERERGLRWDRSAWNAKHWVKVLGLGPPRGSPWMPRDPSLTPHKHPRLKSL